MKALKKVIESLILPMFPWVVDYDIIPIKISDVILIRIVYYTDGVIEVSKDHQKIEEQTKTLYNMIGGVDNAIYEGIAIKSIENKGVGYKYKDELFGM